MAKGELPRSAVKLRRRLATTDLGEMEMRCMEPSITTKASSSTGAPRRHIQRIATRCCLFWIVCAALLVALLVGGCTGVTGPAQPANAQQSLSVTRAAASAAVQAPAGCPITPIYTTPYRGPGSTTIPATLPSVQAEPASSGITGHLFYAVDAQHTFLHTGGQFPDGPADKILWLIENPPLPRAYWRFRERRLRINKRALTRSASGVFSPAHNYPSIINVPVAGCWRFTLTSGTVTGTLTVWVVDN